jgi:hypothetical protein
MTAPRHTATKHFTAKERKLSVSTEDIKMASHEAPRYAPHLGSSGREGSGRARSETPAEVRASPRAQVRRANAVRRNAPEAGRMFACASRDACGAPSARRDKSRRGRARGSSARVASALATTTTYREGKKGSF